MSSIAVKYGAALGKRDFFERSDDEADLTVEEDFDPKSPYVEACSLGVRFVDASGHSFRV